ncbi:PREDICTED: uncharacterized protein LOC109171098 [Ipomoea nil]|uniref:uncharacterized protein LOC109171098 n=1 Tax=Ipomoea nil TaxID=35883 RepID=UPI000901801F|nr:PREDICTED: uncharacterized protein LOC109171098 [Ipomoea nil]
MCGMANEDTMYALVSCDYAKSIWSQSHLPIPINMTNVFYTWFSELLNILDTNQVIHAAAILYYIWRARNGAVWDACLPRPRRVLASAAAVVHAWKQAHPSRDHTPMQHATGLPNAVVQNAQVRQQQGVAENTLQPPETHAPLLK